LKIETRDEVQSLPLEEKPQRTDPGLVARAAIVIVLAVCLLISLRWALNVTTANARQVSFNLTHLQDRMDSPVATGRTGNPTGGGQQKPGQDQGDGPILEPADSR
jgi:hypothetical protein